MTGPPVWHHREHRGLAFAFDVMARPDRFPFGGMFGKISLGGRYPPVAHRRQPPRIMGDDARLARGKRPFLGLTDNLRDRPFGGDAQENPASLAPPLDDPRLDEDTDMARYAQLAQIGRAHVGSPVTNAQLVCRLLLEHKKNKKKRLAQKL